MSKNPMYLSPLLWIFIPSSCSNWYLPLYKASFPTAFSKLLMVCVPCHSYLWGLLVGQVSSLLLVATFRPFSFSLLCSHSSWTLLPSDNTHHSPTLQTYTPSQVTILQSLKSWAPFSLSLCPTSCHHTWWVKYPEVTLLGWPFILWLPDICPSPTPIRAVSWSCLDFIMNNCNSL